MVLNYAELPIKDRGNKMTDFAPRTTIVCLKNTKCNFFFSLRYLSINCVMNTFLWYRCILGNSLQALLFSPLYHVMDHIRQERLFCKAQNNCNLERVMHYPVSFGDFAEMIRYQFSQFGRLVTQLYNLEGWLSCFCFFLQDHAQRHVSEAT